MRVHFALKTAVVAALGITSSLVTLTVMSRAKRAHAREIQGPPPTTTTRVAVAGPERVRMAGQPVRSISSGRMQLTDYTTRGNFVHIAATGFLRDMRPGMRWVWCVRVTDPDDVTKVLFEKIYKDQIFSMPEELEMPLAFEDIVEVPLPRGKYLLDFAAHEIHPGRGLEVQRDDRQGGRGLRGPSALVHVTLDP